MPLDDPDIENLLRHYQLAGPRPELRQRVLATPIPFAASPRWPLYAFRAAIAALLLLSIGMLLAADRINRQTAAQIGLGPVRWTPEAQAAADLVAPGPPGRQYIAFLMVSDRARQSLDLERQGLTAPQTWR